VIIGNSNAHRNEHAVTGMNTLLQEQPRYCRNEYAVTEIVFAGQIALLQDCYRIAFNPKSERRPPNHWFCLMETSSNHSNSTFKALDQQSLALAKGFNETLSQNRALTNIHVQN